MSLTQIRQRLNTLKRKFALPLAILRLRRQAEKLCHQWAIARADQHPIPEPHTLVQQITHAIRLPLTTHRHLHSYLERARNQNTHPDPYEIARTLLPQQAASGLLPHFFHYDLNLDP